MGHHIFIMVSRIPVRACNGCACDVQPFLDSLVPTAMCVCMLLTKNDDSYFRVLAGNTVNHDMSEPALAGRSKSANIAANSCRTNSRVSSAFAFKSSTAASPVAPCAVQRHAKREKNDFLSLSASNNKTVPSPLQDDAHMKLESGVWKADVRIQVPGRCTIHSVAKTTNRKGSKQITIPNFRKDLFVTCAPLPPCSTQRCLHPLEYAS